MDTFRIERRRKASFSVLYPESHVTERHLWGQTNCGTDGYWLKYRLVNGQLLELWNRIEQIANEYNRQRKLMPHIDQLRLFEEVPPVRATSVDYWPYAGRIDTLSRESVVVMFSNGQRMALNRNDGFGFYGIITRSEEAWSLEKFAENMLWRYRIWVLNMARTFNAVTSTVPVRQPWLLRAAAEQNLRNLLNLAYTEFTQEATLTNLEKVISVETVLREYILKTLRWAHFLPHWEHMERIPFPDRATALRLWEEQLIPNMIFDETDPWWIDNPKENSVQVRALRAAYATNGRVNITLNMFPQITTLEHPDVNVAHHMITYGLPPHRGVGTPNQDKETRWQKPILGWDGTPAWGGFYNTVPPWTYLKAESESVPEPMLDVRTRPIAVNKHTTELLETALSGDRPTLVFVSLNNACCPVLVLPRIFFKLDVVPLYGGGTSLKATEEGNKIEGYVTNGNGQQLGPIFDDPPAGFLPTASANRPVREGNLQEILPFS